MSGLQELIARLEKATGPDRELDAAIFETTTGVSAYRETIPYGANSKPQRRMLAIPAYTGSLDAALTLVPAEYDWITANVNGQLGGTPYACCGSVQQHVGATPAIALCIAALMARAVAEAA